MLHRRRALVVLVAILGIALCPAIETTSIASSSPAASRKHEVRKARLVLLYTGIEPNGEVFAEISYRLKCAPASGSLPQAARACEAIAREPRMVFGAEPRGAAPRCHDPTSTLEVSGTYGGRAVRLSFSGCGGPRYGGWGEFFLPAARRDMARLRLVRIDRAIGPFILGAAESMLPIPADSAPVDLAEGLQVYTREEPGLVSCSGDTRQGQRLIALRFGGSGALLTVMANEGLAPMLTRVVVGSSDELKLAGSKPDLTQLVPQCGLPDTVPRAQGPLSSWVTVTCGTQEALADHVFAAASEHAEGPTTIIIPGVLPLVIVTSEPDSACQDAARLHEQLGV